MKSVEQFIAAGYKRRDRKNPPPLTAAEHRRNLRVLRALAAACPFCGKPPIPGPAEPWNDGNAWGFVACENGNCSAAPVVKDNSDIADERGPAAYIALAIKRWNRRAAAGVPASKAASEIEAAWEEIPLTVQDLPGVERLYRAACGVGGTHGR